MKGIQNVSLVKEQSSPAVFLVVGNTKFWIVDPNEFNALGFDWNKIQVVDDGTLGGFTQKLLHAPNPTRPSDVYVYPNCVYHYISLDPFCPGDVYTNCQNPASLVRKDVLVAGWLKDPDVPSVNTTGRAQPGVEDIHYAILLDAGFLDRMYGPNGLSTALRGAVWPGNPPLGAAANVPFDYVVTDAPGKPPHQDFNSWVLPGGGNALSVELNAWHTSCTSPGISGHAHWQGLGPPPAGWVNPLPQDADAWFPFGPLDPEGIGQPLKQNDYVVIRGALWQDTGHDPGSTGSGPGYSYDGWGEIHPLDWIVRVSPPSSNARLTTYPRGGVTIDRYLKYFIPPDFQPSSSTKELKVRPGSVQTLIDTRFTNGLTYTTTQTPGTDSGTNGVEVVVTINPTRIIPPPSFRASWLVGWSETDSTDRPWVDDRPPLAAALHGDGEGWDWTSDNVFFGRLAHRSALASGMHQHYFQGNTNPFLPPVEPLMITSVDDILFAMVYLDPDSPPDEVMLQWHTTDWLSRAYWGENLINWGTNGTAERFYMGPLPPTGEWVRLEVPASIVGLCGGAPQAPIKVNGMAFTLFNGRAIWDYAGVYRPRSDAAFSSQHMAALFDPGATFHATVTMTNTGLTTWTASGNTPYRLGSQNPQDNTIWGLGRVDVPTAVPPGASVTFSFPVTAPAQQGNYNFQWRMVNEAVEWFGELTPNIVVTVDANKSIVPNLTYHTPQEATSIAQRAGFVMVIQNRITVQGLKQPLVRAQYPDPGTIAPSGSTITVDIEIPPAGP